MEDIRSCYAEAEEVMRRSDNGNVWMMSCEWNAESFMHIFKLVSDKTVTTPMIAAQIGYIAHAIVLNASGRRKKALIGNTNTVMGVLAVGCFKEQMFQYKDLRSR